MERFLALAKSNHKKKFGKDYPLEIFWEARDKAYFTEMWEETREVEPTIFFYYNGMRVGSRPRRVKLSELRKKVKEMGVKGVYKMRKAKLEAMISEQFLV